MSKPEVRRVGDNWLYLWSGEGVAIGMEQLRERSDGLHAEITIKALEDGEPAGHIHWSQLNLSAGRTRVEIAERLKKRDAATPWGDLIETACVLTARGYRNGLEVVNLAEVEVPDGARPYLIERLLPKNEISLFYADGASGKSLTALLLAVCCETGVVLPAGLKLQGQGCKTWYCDYETNARAHARRLLWLSRGLGLDGKPNLLYSKMSRPFVQNADSIRQHIHDKQIGLLIVDSAGYAADGDINEAQVATRLCNSLASMNTTVLLIHHVNKEAAKATTGPVKPYGSAYFYNSARNAWEIRSTHPREGVLSLALFHRKDNDDELQKTPIGIQFLFNTTKQATAVKGLRVEDDPELAGHGGLAFQLRGLLRNGAMTVKDLADETGATVKQIDHALRRMSDAMQVKPGGRGRGNAAEWGLATHDE